MATPETIVPAIAFLLKQGTPRAASFLVTLFGDLAREDGRELSGTTLSALTGRVGIKPEAMRVALHRLRKDGWIESHRAGRTSRYFLTTFGRRETKAVSSRIYANEGQNAAKWHVIIARNVACPCPYPTLFSPLPGVFLGVGPAPDAPDFFTLTGQIGQPPDWVRDAVISESQRLDFTDFAHQLAGLAPLLPSEIPPPDRNVLRGLIIHTWRRLLLRHPDLPDSFFPEACRIGCCRDRVQALLSRLGAPQITA